MTKYAEVRLEQHDAIDVRERENAGGRKVRNSMKVEARVLAEYFDMLTEALETSSTLLEELQQRRLFIAERTKAEEHELDLDDSILSAKFSESASAEEMRVQQCVLRAPRAPHLPRAPLVGPSDWRLRLLLHEGGAVAPRPQGTFGGDRAP